MTHTRTSIIPKDKIFQHLKPDSSGGGLYGVTGSLENAGRAGQRFRHMDFPLLSNAQTSYHGRLAFHLRKTFADAFYGQMNLVGRADIDQKNVVLAIFDQLAQPRLQFGAPAPGEPALKDGKLKPFAIALHGFEHAPPAPLIGDVVGYDVKPFIAHATGLNGLSGCCDCAQHDGGIAHAAATNSLFAAAWLKPMICLSPTSLMPRA